MKTSKKTLLTVAGALAAVSVAGLVAAQTIIATNTEVKASDPGMVLVDITRVARDINRNLDTQGQLPGIVWVPASVAADVCGVAMADLAPPAVGHAAVCLAQRSSPSLQNHVKRDLMGGIVE
jgi:hypothetical protein